MNQLTQEMRAKAEIYHGDSLCKEKSQELLNGIFMPDGLLPLHDIEECGIVRDTGFVWLKQKKKINHKFEKIGRMVSYDTEVTAIVDHHIIKKLTGVKAKEMMIWVTIGDIYLDKPPTGKIHFKSPTGLSRTFPVDAFQLEAPKKVVQPTPFAEMKEV